jgi:hypothetical protein
MENVDDNDIQELSLIRNQTESYQNELNGELIEILNEKIHKIFDKYF